MALGVMDPASRPGDGRETGWVNRLFTKDGYTPEYQELKFTLHRKLLDRINLEALSSMAGERVRAEIRAAVANGVVKMNLDTDMQYAFTHAIETHLSAQPKRSGVGVDKAVYDPRAWGRKAEAAMAERVIAAAETLGSHGKTIA